MPAGIITTGWPAVEARCSEWGDAFDLWQQGLGRAILGKRASGKYAATVGGVTLSIPRQVAKTFLVGRIIFALCTLFPGLKVIWTAHRTRTSDETFRKLAGLARRKGAAQYVLAVRRANGQQEIEFRNGSRIMFGAREQGFGRGFDEVDIEVFDEAQILGLKALEDMVAATNQARHPHGALLFFMGTPPRPTDPGEVFRNRRSDALAGNSTDALYMECSADPDVGRPGGPSLDDRKQWKKANASYPERTPEESMLRLRHNLPDDDSWRREALGVWDDENTVGAIPAADWDACRDLCNGKLDKTAGTVALVVETAQDRSSSILVVAGTRVSDGIAQVEVVPPKRDGDQVAARWTDWVPGRVAEVVADNANITDLVIDSRAAAAPLLLAIRERLDDLASRTGRTVTITETSSSDVAEACALFYDAIVQHALRHEDTPTLTDAVRAAVWKDLESGGRVWSRKLTGAHAPALMAMTLGLWRLRRADDYDVMDSVLI